MNWDREELKAMPTLAQGQCCNLKVETAALRYIGRLGVKVDEIKRSLMEEVK
jgi:hypothetical protein